MVAHKNQLREQCGTRFEVEGLDIAIFIREGRYFAINNVCAHQHFSMLHQGEIDGLTVECPMHGWVYDLESGIARTGNGRVAAYPVHLDGDNIFVELPDPE